MKTLKNILIVYLLLLSNSVFGQHEYIDSLKIIPPNPTSTDVVKVVCYSEFRYSSCKLDTFSVIVSNHEISVTAEYNVGIGAAFCSSVDTLSVGILEVGDYNLAYLLKHSYLQTVYDTAYLTFTVSESTSVIEKNTAQGISVYPNPTQSELFLEEIPAGAEFKILNTVGAEVAKGVYEGNAIPVSHLSQGVYLLQIQTREQVFQARFVKE